MTALQEGPEEVVHFSMTATSTRPGEQTALKPSPAFAEATAPPSRRGLLVGVFVVVAVVSAVCIHQHSMWFDELQAWNIARASHSLPDLFSNLRYEGHPPLWYLPLFALTRFTGDPVAMQVAGWLIVLAVDAIVLFRSPFPVPARIALVAGYFFAFEYSVITRSYGLGMLLLVTALALLGRPRPRWLLVSVMLALLAWSSLAGAVLAGAIASSVALMWWRDRSRVASRGALACAAATVVSCGFAVLVCIPPSDFHSFSIGIPNSARDYLEPSRFAGAVAGTWRGLVPVPATVGQWNTNVVDQWPGGIWLQAALALALVVPVARALRPYAFAFALWIVGTVAYVAFSIVVVLPDRTHYAGEFFLLFMACAWLAYAPPSGHGRVGTAWRAGLPAVLVVVLAAQIVATLAILPDATASPFAPDRTLAEVAERAGFAQDVVSGQDYDGAAIAGYLDEPVWSIARGEPMRFFVADEREAAANRDLTPARLVCGAAAVAASRARPVALVVDKPMPTPDGVRLLFVIQGVHLYRVAPEVAAACAS